MSGIAVTLSLGAKHSSSRIGSNTMNELSIVIFMIIAGAFWAVMSYSVGFKEGQRQGYTRGRAVARHAVSAERKAVK
jgi:hypothetical protein